MSARGTGRRRAGRRGMTLVEVLVALVILGTVLVGLAEYMGRFARDVNQSAARATAADLVASRLESLKSVTRYDRLEAMARTESNLPGYPGFQRTTQVRRVQTTVSDYKIVTVSVTHARLSEPVRKTTMIARF